MTESSIAPLNDSRALATDLESLNLFQKILMATDGTVTDLIGLYTGETISVTKLEQTIGADAAPPVLACAAGERVLRRKILLRGVKANYLYADSFFIVERMSPSIQKQLLETDKPIGLMWKSERLETYREIIERKVSPCAEIAEYFNLPSHSLFASRTYLIHHAGKPLGAITEKWPTSLFRDAQL